MKFKINFMQNQFATTINTMAAPDEGSFLLPSSSTAPTTDANNRSRSFSTAACASAAAIAGVVGLGIVGVILHYGGPTHSPLLPLTHLSPFHRERHSRHDKGKLGRRDGHSSCENNPRYSKDTLKRAYELPSSPPSSGTIAARRSSRRRT